jgi:hypothetical protein
MTSNEISRIRIQNFRICFECSTNNTYTIFVIVTKPISSQKTISGFSKMKYTYFDLLAIEIYMKQLMQCHAVLIFLRVLVHVGVGGALLKIALTIPIMATDQSFQQCLLCIYIMWREHIFTWLICFDWTHYYHLFWSKLVFGSKKNPNTFTELNMTAVFKKSSLTVTLFLILTTDFWESESELSLVNECMAKPLMALLSFRI